MIICHCKAVSDRAIRDAVRGGAETPREVSRACGAGRVCGGCRPAVRRIVELECAAQTRNVDEALGIEAPLAAAS